MKFAPEPPLGVHVADAQSGFEEIGTTAIIVDVGVDRNVDRPVNR